MTKYWTQLDDINDSDIIKVESSYHSLDGLSDWKPRCFRINSSPPSFPFLSVRKNSYPIASLTLSNVISELEATRFWTEDLVLFVARDTIPF